LEEHLFDGFIGISSSAIAFMLDFVHALSMGGVAEGIPYAKALEIVAATMGSTTALLASSACHPIALVSSVCSAGGTTIEGMEALADGAFEATVMAAVRASAEKNRTLEATALEHNNREDKQ
jgi:pyrroline-5-carboxylate reductase